MVNLTKEKSLMRIQTALDSIPALIQNPKGTQEFEKWFRTTKTAITYIFGKQSQQLEDFDDISYSPIIYTTDTPDSVFHEAHISGLEYASSVLESMREEIEEYWEDDKEEMKVVENESLEDSKSNIEIFIIHGRDDGLKETVARFISTLGLIPIILHEQSNQGRTIIEKFEKHARVGFAIALLTPDDLGALQEEAEDLKPRARQNVIFEFGYFMGSLGRQHVCALVKDDVDLPSDSSGILYISYDKSGAWKMMLARELKEAGYEVDANLAL